MKLTHVSLLAAVACVCLSGGVLELVRSSNGIMRSLYFWWGIFPVYLHYRTIQLLKRDLGLLSHEVGERMYSDAHNRHAHHVRDLHHALRGYYLKNAQLLSTQPDLLPQAYMSWARETQDNVPSEFAGPEDAKNYCRELLRDQLGLDFDDVFSYWEDEPLGIASIGQVHRCRLRRNNQTVAVKLQFRGMERRFRSDIHTLRAFALLAMPQHASAFDEVERGFDAEFDYLQEARNLIEVREAVLPEFGHKVYIPRPYLEYTSRGLLVMEFLEGKSLMEGFRGHFSALAGLLDTTLEGLEAMRDQLLRNSSFPYKTLAQERTDGRRLRRLAFLRNLNPLKLLRRPPTAVSQEASLMHKRVGGGRTSRWGAGLLDVADILDTLCAVHGSEVRPSLFKCDDSDYNATAITARRF
jgi:aarF domain-containing kinase